ncbi:MAG TPA: neutral/alkaline non-lysosomal ceramidase N-terminal domain-containing protein [Planctomicrobium sp.]|nr:neutral/alkaline non-lysosomal ceramidase N-terminal domain-containing protein [Planctomicrobium sp.]
MASSFHTNAPDTTLRVASTAVRRTSVFPILLCITLCFVWGGVAQAVTFRAGAATSNITPELGKPVEGYGSKVPTTQVHDELHARCLVLDDGETTLVIVVCDLLGVHLGLSAKARQLIEERCGIPSQNVLITATHAHSTVGGTSAGQRFSMSDVGLSAYQLFVVNRIVDGVMRAKNHLSPAQMAFGTVNAPEYVFNRRVHMKPGTVPVNPFGSPDDKVQMSPPGASPNYVKPAGPVDPVMSFISIRNEDGTPLALLASYSMHYVGAVPAEDVSADYFGEFCRKLGQKIEVKDQFPAFVPMLSNGASGDVVSTDFQKPRPKNPPYERIQKIADDLAERVFQAERTLKYRNEMTLAVRYREPIVQMRRPDPQLMSWAKRKTEEAKSVKPDMSHDYARRTLIASGYPTTAPAPLQVFRIGEICIGTMPFETFCETGLAFKRHSPLQPAILIGLTNGYMGYLPTPQQHNLGGYETWLGTNHVERNTSEDLLAELLEMAGELQLEKSK